MLYLIGIGLRKEEIPKKALEIKAELFLENYTSIYPSTSEELEKIFGREIKVLNRKQIEEEMPFIQEDKDTALLIIGDPLCATTHQAILDEAKSRKIEVKIIHASSILTAIAETGLAPYDFGKVTSIPFWKEHYEPCSFFDVYLQNKSIGAHTLFLLDLNPPESMSPNKAAEILLECAKRKKSNDLTDDTECIVVSRLGFDNQDIQKLKFKDIINNKFGQGPHSIIVLGC